MSAFKFSYMLFKKYFWQGIFYLATLLLAVVFSMALVQISRYVLDFVLRPTTNVGNGLISRFLSQGGLGEIGSSDLLVKLCLIFGGIVIVKAIVQYVGGRVSQNYGNKYGNDLRMTVLKKMFLSNQYSSTGDIYTMLVYDAFYTKELYQTLIPQMLSFMFYSLLSCIMIFLTNWKLGLFVLVSMPLVVFLCIMYIKSTKPYFVLIRRNSRKISTEISSATNGILDIKTNGFEEGELVVLKNRNNQYVSAKKECTTKSNKYQMYLMLLRAIFYGGMIIFAGYLAIVGEITIGGFSVAVSYSVMMLDNIVNSAVKLYQVQEALYYAENLSEYVLQKNKKSNSKTKEVISGDVNLSAEKLCVETTDGHNLNKFSFNIKQGEKVGFCFKDGNGCHAFCEVLIRMFEPSNGGLSLNGLDYKEINIESFREQFSSFSPNVYLFKKSIKQNIVMFEEYDEQKYNQITKLVGLDKFSQKLPNGDNEVIKGKYEAYPVLQKQMIGLCRALFKNSKIIILEKPLQALCSTKVADIIDKINKLDDRTVIVVSSDFESMKNCQKVFIVDNGEIVDCVENNEKIKE